MSRKRKTPQHILDEGIKTITSDLLFCLGLNISDDGYLTDQDTGNIFQVNDKCLRCTIYGNPVIHKGDIKLDIFNIRLITSIFNYILSRSSVEDGIYYRLYNEDRRLFDDVMRSSLVLKSSENEMRTNFYQNDTYKYIEMIYRVCNHELPIANLLTYDLEEYRTR